MTVALDPTQAAGPPLSFDPNRLDAWLRAQLPGRPGLEGPMVLTPIVGGQSNPTFFIDYPGRRLVLRKRPAGELLPSAHAVDREYRIQAALADSGVPVPRMLAFHAGPEVVGTAFYVMERLDGRVFADCTLQGVAPAKRRAMVLDMADTLARLHRVDWRALGLADYGREGGYFERQLARWRRQWELSKTRDLPALEELMAWLAGHRPADDLTLISHGDFRLGNLMFHPTEPRVVGVLDWELSTLGHPLADVAYSALAWRLAPDEYMGMRGADLAVLGIPTEQEYLARYAAGMPGAGPVTAFHTAFALFRLAVIFEGIAARAQAGNAQDGSAAQVGRLASVFTQRALESIAAA